MIGDDKDFSGKVCVKWKDTELERQVRSESLIPRGDAIHAQATVSNRSEADGAVLEQPRSRQAPQEVLVLCLVTQKSRATSILKITTAETTFLPVKSTAESQHARTSNERNKLALQGKCSCRRNKSKVMSTQRIPTSCIVLHVAVKIT